MKKRHHSTKSSQPKSIRATARHAVAHAMVFGLISLAGHIAVTSLTASVSAIGLGIAPAISSMYMM